MYAHVILHNDETCGWHVCAGRVKHVVDLDHTVARTGPHDGGDFDHLCGVENLNSVQGEIIVSRSVFMVRHPRGSFMVSSSPSLEVATPENESIRSMLSSMYTKVRLTSGS